MAPHTPASSIKREVLRDRERVAVLVEPEMRVRVERRAPLRQQRCDPLALCREQLLGTFDQGGIGHHRSLYALPMPEATPLGADSQATATTSAPSCGEAVVRLLEQYDVDTVFGIPGVHTLEMYRGLAASEIRHVSPRHEQGAAFMADGYARIKGKPGVCLLITGAGLTNAATPIAGAYHDSIPMLVVSSATATKDNGRGHGSLHDLPDQRAFMATITAESIDVRTPAELPEAFARAFEIFDSRRPRPVHIGIPIDVLGLPATVVGAPAGARSGAGRRRRARGARRGAAGGRRAPDAAARRRRHGRGRRGGRRGRAPRGAGRHDGQRQGPAAGYATRSASARR